MQTRILDGAAVAEQIKSELRVELEALRAVGIVPGLAAALVGENPASQIYVRNKVKTCQDLGIHSESHELPATTSQAELIDLVKRLNARDEIDGVLVQLPLPGHIDSDEVLQTVAPAKDVDGFHPENVGRLVLGTQRLAPCTPMGVMELLRREGIELKGTRAVVVGRSNIVGKPMALLLLHQHATVTICHSRTRDLPGVCREADLLIAAIGRPALLTRDYIKPGATVIDVGMNRLQDLDQIARIFGPDSPKLESARKRGSALVGDVHPIEALGLAGALTPVPGGVGPLTIAHLLKNTVLACRLRRGTEAPAGAPTGDIR
jgi:methylenetetrahydrofolate dehydrogenase (NADP+)/methenyltetrahydrofolate cyclohydrolase